MARIKIENICEKLEYGLKKALADAVRRTIPDAEFNEIRLFKEFVRAVGRKCRTWETVPDQYIEPED